MLLLSSMILMWWHIHIVTDGSGYSFFFTAIALTFFLFIVYVVIVVNGFHENINEFGLQLVVSSVFILFFFVSLIIDVRSTFKFVKI